MNRSLCWVGLVTVLLAGCGAQPSRPSMATLFGKRVELQRDGRFTAKSFTIDLPAGWVRKPLGEDAVVASLDGVLLQMITAEQRNLDKAFPRTKKAARPEALSSELAELEIAEMKASGPQMAALEILENEPATLSGQEGFRLMFRFRTQRGLTIQRVVLGCVTKTGYYRLDYVAPALNYFTPSLPAFEKAAESFTLIGPKTASAP